LKIPYRSEARGEMTENVIFKVSSLEQLSLEEVIPVGDETTAKDKMRIHTKPVDSRS
jgi:hypothetical protein